MAASTSMISALCWIPKGVCKYEPDVAEQPSKEEIEQAIQSGALKFKRGDGEEDDDDEDEEMDVDSSGQVDEVGKALAAARALGGEGKNRSGGGFQDISEAIQELNMDDYDNEEQNVEIFSSGLGDAYYPSNKLDPYLQNDDDEDEDEIEDMTIRPSDGIIVCAHNDDEINHLQVWVLEDPGDEESNMYSHHEILLPAFPLCMAWLNCNLKSEDKGNFIAVGTMDPAIEIWDLDILDEVEPFKVLGGVVKSKKAKKAKKSSLKYKKDSHKDSVLGLAWNKEFRNVLASASADNMVKVWDVATGKCALTAKHHSNKVQAVAWNPYSPQLLLSGSFDHSVVLMDMQSNASVANRWSVPADVESLAWDPHSEHTFVVSLENGTVNGFDTRVVSSDSTSSSKSCFTLHAHDKAVCSVAYNPVAPNLLATGSSDKMVKLWDMSDNKPSCIASTNRKAGSVFSISFYEDSPFMLAIGGAKGKLKIWDIMKESEVAKRFRTP